MNGWILALAIALQTADAAVTCDRLRAGWREANPLYSESCRGIVVAKAVGFAPLPVFRSRKLRNAWGVGLAAGGGLGLTVTLTLGRP